MCEDFHVESFNESIRYDKVCEYLFDVTNYLMKYAGIEIDKHGIMEHFESYKILNKKEIEFIKKQIEYRSKRILFYGD